MAPLLSEKTCYLGSRMWGITVMNYDPSLGIPTGIQRIIRNWGGAKVSPPTMEDCHLTKKEENWLYRREE